MTELRRRSFLKISGLTAGGFFIGFNFTGCKSSVDVKAMPTEWTDINAFLQIGDTGIVTIFSPNPEIGQNIKTSMPMLVAEELDVAWKDVMVKQAPLDLVKYTRQVAGGSQSIRQGWESLRTAGATARQMLVNAAAKSWGVDPSLCSTNEGIVSGPDNKTIGYGELAKLAAQEPVPTDVKLKEVKDFKIISKDTKNVDIEGIITGKSLFGIDTKREGMRYASVLRPPSFGQELIAYDDTEAKAIVGVERIEKFGNKIAIIATDTWSAMKGQKALKATWTEGNFESTTFHDEKMAESLSKKGETKREDGDTAKAMKLADRIIEKTYEAPFLPHSCLEPMNFFAHVTEEKADLYGPIQTPDWTRSRVAELLEMEKEKVFIGMSRMGGGFGRRLYGDFALEAAEVSKITGLPIQLVFSREDDMTAGTYRPASKYKFRAAIKDGQMTAYELDGVIMNNGNSTREQNFPACCVENYKVTSSNVESNITTGAWRAPIANFLACAEQSFIDEVAEAVDKDPVAFRLELLERAKTNPVGDLEYDPDKMIGVIKLAAEKSGWGTKVGNVHQGFSVYYSHNSYVAEVAEVAMETGSPVVKKVYCAVDCGIVVNPIAALNQVEGGIIDGIGHAMYSEFKFENGRTTRTNFDKYRMIKMSEAPEVETHFVQSENDPTGLGEPTLPPAGGAVANALYQATRQRHYRQPFIQDISLLG